MKRVVIPLALATACLLPQAASASAPQPEPSPAAAHKIFDCTVAKILMLKPWRSLDGRPSRWHREAYASVHCGTPGPDTWNSVLGIQNVVKNKEGKKVWKTEFVTPRTKKKPDPNKFFRLYAPCAFGPHRAFIEVWGYSSTHHWYPHKRHYSSVLDILNCFVPPSEGGTGRTPQTTELAAFHRTPVRAARRDGGLGCKILHIRQDLVKRLKNHEKLLFKRSFASVKCNTGAFGQGPPPREYNLQLFMLRQQRNGHWEVFASTPVKIKIPKPFKSYELLMPCLPTGKYKARADLWGENHKGDDIPVVVQFSAVSHVNSCKMT
jgi:hypothetical protein